MSLSNREFLIREREGVKEREGWAGRSAGRHIYGYVRCGRDRGERQRYREIERHRNKET
jgi:hypothetical protein